MAAVHLIILLSVGNFQALLPGISPQPSPVFDDNAQGARAFTSWAKSTMPVPGFNQPPLRICVVGAVPFKPEAAPYLPKPLYESTFPLRALEPYSATFHYVEDDKAGKPARPRTMKQAQKICAEVLKKPPPSIVIPQAPASAAAKPR